MVQWLGNLAFTQKTRVRFPLWQQVDGLNAIFSFIIFNFILLFMNFLFKFGAVISICNNIRWNKPQSQCAFTLNSAVIAIRTCHKELERSVISRLVFTINLLSRSIFIYSLTRYHQTTIKPTELISTLLFYIIYGSSNINIIEFWK